MRTCAIRGPVRAKTRIILTASLLLAILLAVYSRPVHAADRLWTDLRTEGTTGIGAKAILPPDSRFRSFRYVKADFAQLQSILTTPTSRLSLPMPDGRLVEFAVMESSVMERELALRFPQIRTYKVRATTDASVTGRVDIGPNGFHAYLFTTDGSVLIDPASRHRNDSYVSYFKRDYLGSNDLAARKPFSCGVRSPAARSDALSLQAPRSFGNAFSNDEILVYRLAAATTGEYSQAVAAGDAVATLAEVVTAINRITLIFERDIGLRMLLVANNDLLIYTDANSDPYTNTDSDALLLENQANIDNVIGSANYDIGHVFATAEGGLANIQAACDDNLKAGGATGLDNPVGDAFYIDYLAHEFGHQFGANHSFNGTTSQCGGGNRNAATAFEPGSGSTIMSYAGICGIENVQEDPDPLSPDQGYLDPTFHTGSIEEILNFVQAGVGASCPTSLATGNAAPIVAAGPDYSIPAATAFTLDGSATDVNTGDTLLYQWDQMDAGFSTNSATYGTDRVTNALFRSFLPTATATRTLPQLATLLNGVPDNAETLPLTARTMAFRLTARDNRGGISDDETVVTVDNSKGPFALLQPNTAVTLNTMATQVIEWNAACTEQAPVSCSAVDILLSTDGGNTFIPLTNNVPNDGEQAVSLPASTSSTARIMIVCSDNIFFDIADVDFALAQDGSGIALAATGNGGSNNCGTGIPAGDDQEPNDAVATAQSISVPFSINGTANSAIDVDDYYVFTVTQANLTFTIDLDIPTNAALQRNNHDLFLYDSSGTNEVARSIRTGSTSESISSALSNGATYYVQVNARDTLGQNAEYALSLSSTQTTPPPPPPSGGGGGALAWWAAISLSVLAYRRRGRAVLAA